MTRTAAQVFSNLADRGLLLLQDKTIPSVVSLVTAETVRGSWWAHRRSHEIFRILTLLAEHPDVLFCKLVAGKVTLVHRRLWPALLAVATSREPWQTRGLSAASKKLLDRVDREGSAVASGPPVRELEKRLLVTARQEHTETGAHRMIAEGWHAWARRARVPIGLSASEGKRRIEDAAAGVGATRSSLPWGLARPSRSVLPRRRGGPKSISE